MPALVESRTPMAAVSIGEFEKWLGSPQPTGTDGITLIHEARRVRRHWVRGSPDKFSPTRLPSSFTAGLRECAAKYGLELESLLNAAEAHFSSQSINQRTEPLSDTELEFLLEDDQRTFGR